MIFIGNSTLSGRSSKKPSLEVYPRKRARHAILKYGDACVLSSGGGSAQVKTWWKPPLTRWRKIEKKLRLPFFRLKSWKGCYSQSRWTFFLERFSMKKNAPRCDEILIFIIFVGRQRFRRDILVYHSIVYHALFLHPPYSIQKSRVPTLSCFVQLLEQFLSIQTLSHFSCIFAFRHENEETNFRKKR